MTPETSFLLRRCCGYALAVYPGGNLPSTARIIDDVPGFRAAVLIGNGETVIAVAGTDCTKDMILDGEIDQVPLGLPFHRVMVHRGFKRWTDALWPRLMLPCIPGPVTLVGHSAGGAVVRQIALRMQASSFTPEIKHIVTFGEPRGLNRAGARDFNAFKIPSIRVVHSLDIVPRVPHWGYRHVREELWLTPEGRAVWNRNWIRKLPEDIHGLWLERRDGLPLLHDHGIATYQAALDKLHP